jgi:hypothetical protein
MRKMAGARLKRPGCRRTKALIQKPDSQSFIKTTFPRLAGIIKISGISFSLLIVPAGIVFALPDGRRPARVWKACKVWVHNAHIQARES